MQSRSIRLGEWKKVDQIVRRGGGVSKKGESGCGEKKSGKSIFRRLKSKGRPRPILRYEERGKGVLRG